MRFYAATSNLLASCDQSGRVFVRKIFEGSPEVGIQSGRVFVRKIFEGSPEVGIQSGKDGAPKVLRAARKWASKGIRFGTCGNHGVSHKQVPLWPMQKGDLPYHGPGIWDPKACDLA
eukprot:1161743-Pelagomonas_calceolata.AAC.6